MLADGTPWSIAPIGEVVMRTGRWSRAICAAGRCGRSPPTCACTAGPSRPTARPSAWNAASHWRGRKPASSARPRSPPAWCSTPAVRSGSAAGRQRARAGELTRDAAAAASGRRHPEQRRRKARQALAAASRLPAVAQANRRAGQPPASPGSRTRWPGGTGTRTSGRSSWPGGQRGQPGGDQPGGRAPQGLAVASPRRHRSRRRRRRAARAPRTAATPGGCPR